VTYINCRLGANVVGHGWNNLFNMYTPAQTLFREYREHGAGGEGRGEDVWEGGRGPCACGSAAAELHRRWAVPAGAGSEPAVPLRVLVRSARGSGTSWESLSLHLSLHLSLNLSLHLLLHLSLNLSRGKQLATTTLHSPRSSY